MDPLGLTKNQKETCPNTVYKALTEQDAARLAAGKSIQGKALNGQWTAAEHVANQPLSRNSVAAGGAAKNSPWISTTKEIDVAKGYDSGHGIAVIDFDKITSTKAEVWQHTSRTQGVEELPYHRSLWSQEVTVYK